jgi:DNA-binding NtrC family response regulator
MLSKDSSLKLYLISDFNDPNYAENLFGQIGDYNLSIVSSKEIIFEQKTPAIYIVQIFENESEILKKLLSLKNIRKDRFVFLISEYSINSITQLIRKGFTHFFLLPDEITHLQKFLIDELKGLDINFVSKYKSLNETNYILKTVFGSGDNANNKIAQTKEYASDRSINIIIEGEIGLGKTNLANTIHQIAKNNDHCLTELIYPYMDNEKFTLKITL